MLAESIFLVPALVGGTLLLLGALIGFYDRDWDPLLDAGFLAGGASLLFLLVHGTVGFVSLFSPWNLSTLVVSWVEVLIYFPLFVLVVRFLKDRTFPEFSPHRLKKIEGKVGRAKKALNREKGVKKKVNSLAEKLGELTGDTGGLDPLNRRCQAIDEKVDSMDDLLSEIEDRTSGDTVEKVSRAVSDQVSSVPEDTAERTVERVSERLSGMKEYEAGQDYQVKSVREFEAEGFDEVRNYPSSSKKPDHVLVNAGQVVGAVEVRHKKITGSKTLKRSNFVTAFDYATEKGVPLILRWWNSETERLWLHVVEPEEFMIEAEDNFKVTVPTWLWHSDLDEEEKREMKRDLLRAEKKIRELAEEE